MLCADYYFSFLSSLKQTHSFLSILRAWNYKKNPKNRKSFRLFSSIFSIFWYKNWFWVHPDLVISPNKPFFDGLFLVNGFVFIFRSFVFMSHGFCFHVRQKKSARVFKVNCAKSFTTQGSFQILVQKHNFVSFWHCCFSQRSFFWRFVFSQRGCSHIQMFCFHARQKKVSPRNFQVNRANHFPPKLSFRNFFFGSGWLFKAFFRHRAQFTKPRSENNSTNQLGMITFKRTFFPAFKTNSI